MSLQVAFLKKQGGCFFEFSIFLDYKVHMKIFSHRSQFAGPLNLHVGHVLRVK